MDAYEHFEGYAVKKKMQEKDGKIKGVTFAVRKDAFDSSNKEQYMTFWINGEREEQLFDSFMPIISEMPESNDDIKSSVAYLISADYTIKGKYSNIHDFNLRKNTPSKIDQAFGEDHTVKAPEIKARQDEHPEQTDIATAGIDITHKMGVKDIQIARGNVLNASVNFVGTVEERVKYCKRLMTFIESGD